MVRGIGDYGNCVGIPTVGGETGFHRSLQRQHPGQRLRPRRAPARDGIFQARASGAGNPILYVGSRTGRDGIHGATMASESFDAESEAKRPTVQVGDPFTEKILLEACLEAMRTGAIVAIQDMGAAGLTSSSFEMAGRGGTGFRLDLDRVPLREPGLTPYEMMLSESQERMVLVARARPRGGARAGLPALGARGGATSARSPTTGRAVLRLRGETCGRHADRSRSPTRRRSTAARSLPPADLAERQRAPEVPAPERPRGARSSACSRTPELGEQGVDLAPVRLTRCAPTPSSGPGGDAAVLRLKGTPSGSP